MPDVFSVLHDLIANPFRNRWANWIARAIFGGLAALLAFLYLRSLFTG